MSRDTRDFLVFMGGGAVVCAVLVSLIVAVAYPLAELGCNQRGGELAVVDADYRLLSDTCYLTLDSGEVIPADQYRASEAIER